MRRGQCRHCLRTREVYSIGRSGGGTYRRGGRHYRSSICGDCAVTLLTYLGGYAGASSSRFDGSGLVSIAETLDTPQARAALIGWRNRRAAPPA